LRPAVITNLAKIKTGKRCAICLNRVGARERRKALLRRALGNSDTIPYVQSSTFPTEVLPDWLREFVESEAGATQTPPDLSGHVGTLSRGCSVREERRGAGEEGLQGTTQSFHGYGTWTCQPKNSVFADVTAPLQAFEQAEL